MTAYEIDGVRPVVDPSSFVHPQASLIGDVQIGPDCYIGPMASLRGDFGRVTVGAGSNIQDSCVIHCFPGRDAVLEENSHVGHGAILHGCHLEPGVLVGMNAVIMDEVRVGMGSIIGANSFLPAGMTTPPHSLLAGTPARFLRELDDADLEWRSHGSNLYRELAERSLETLREVEPLSTPEPNRRRVTTGRNCATPLHEVRRRQQG